MSNEWLSELFSQVQHHFADMQPLLPTYALLVVSAVLPIYAGAHASLHRPVSAAKPPKKQRKDDDEDGLEPQMEEDTQLAAGLEMSDVLLYPLLAGAMLTGLYYLIKYLDDPAVISKILNWYLSVFGLYGVATFLSDSLGTISSYVFPDKYYHADRVWFVDGARRLVLPQRTGDKDTHPGVRQSPLPAILSSLPIPVNVLWWFRDLVHKPAMVVDLQVLKDTVRLRPTPVKLNSAAAAVAVVAYFNLIGPPWWMTNLLGFSFTYSAFQIMSPTTFSIGTLLLVGLFFYDIYMVFYTPMMITVASKLDIPAKLVFPKPDSDSGKSQYAMLGLGDIVVPGIIIALALRFDLYMYYLKRQRLVKKASETPEMEPRNLDYRKETYVRVTGTWGDRFWLGRHAINLIGGQFPKYYFNAAMMGYVSGLIMTVTIMHVFQHGQPALLYLVPCVLGAIWTTALVRQELKIMWMYTEDADDARKAGLDSAAVLPSAHPNQIAVEGKEAKASTVTNDQLAAETAAHTAMSDAASSDHQHEPTRNGHATTNGSAPERQPEATDHPSASGKALTMASEKKPVNRRLLSLVISLPPIAPGHSISSADALKMSDMQRFDAAITDTSGAQKEW